MKSYNTIYSHAFTNTLSRSLQSLSGTREFSKKKSDTIYSHAFQNTFLEVSIWYHLLFGSVIILRYKKLDTICSFSFKNSCRAHSEVFCIVCLFFVLFCFMGFFFNNKTHIASGSESSFDIFNFYWGVFDYLYYVKTKLNLVTNSAQRAVHGGFNACRVFLHLIRFSHFFCSRVFIRQSLSFINTILLDHIIYTSVNPNAPDSRS